MNKGNKGMETKLKILNEATNLFYRNGYESLTFQKVAEKIGITQPALYKYFSNKTILLSDCALLAAQKGRDFIDSSVDAAERADVRLRKYVDANIDFFQFHRPEAYAILSTNFFAHSSKEIMQTLMLIEMMGLKRIEEILMSGSHEKHWKVKDPKALAKWIHSFLMGEVYKVFHHKSTNLEECKSHVWKGVQALIGVSLRKT